MSSSLAVLVLAGIIAKGLAAIAGIFALGLLVGVILTVSVSRMFRR